MAALVSQAAALRQLRLVAAALSAEELADVMFKAEQASAIVVDYLKRPFDDAPTAPETVVGPFRPRLSLTPQPLADDEPLVPWTEATTPTLVKSMILVVLTSLYDGRTPDDVLLSDAVTSVLWRMRDPALA
jgi:hypothetical protein